MAWSAVRQTSSAQRCRDNDHTICTTRDQGLEEPVLDPFALLDVGAVLLVEDVVAGSGEPLRNDGAARTAA